MTNALRVIFAGSGEFGVPTLRVLVGAGHEITLVVSQPDRPAGRGRTLSPTPIARFAAENSLPLLKTGNINQETFPPADLMIVIAFGQKIAQPVATHPRLGSINLHASRLPKYRGAAPINWAIIDGETVTGNSIIRLAERMDAGPILAQSELAIGELETAGELHDRLAQDGAALVQQTMQELAAGRSVEWAQNDSLATNAPKLSRQDRLLDFTWPAERLARHIRGLYPWPGCRVELLDANGNRLLELTLVRARSVQRAGDAEPGTLANDLVTAGNRTALEILELQPIGKRPMSLQAFKNGHAWQDGMLIRAIA